MPSKKCYLPTEPRTKTIPLYYYLGAALVVSFPLRKINLDFQNVIIVINENYFQTIGSLSQAEKPY